LLKTYARGRRAFAAAYADPTAANFHELRKRSKYHRYHLRVLVPVWPTVLKPFLGAAHDLTDLLGENQDLSVMRSTLREEPELFDRGRDLQVLLGLVERRQSELQSLAKPLARRIFAEKPATATARLGVYWQAWAEAPAEGPAEAAGNA
jgi:CHAD domain-containing protein